MPNTATPSLLASTREAFRNLLKGDPHTLEVKIDARPLTPEAAIGRPDRSDLPLQQGRERIVEAILNGTRGHAFTDAPASFSGSLEDVLQLSLATATERAWYVATLNALLAHLGRIETSVHCRDDSPTRCGQRLAEQLWETHGAARLGLIGLNPAIAEALVKRFGAERVRIADLDSAHIGRLRFGVEIEDGRTAGPGLITGSDCLLITGTTLVNGSFDGLHTLLRAAAQPYLLYGVSASGPAALLGLPHTCPLGISGLQS